VPGPPSSLDLSVLSGESVRVALSPPLSDGGAPVMSYVVDWDPAPGVPAVQVVTTRVNTGPNEAQRCRTSVTDVDEVQLIASSATPVAEVQRVTVTRASSGTFALQLDTSATGGSAQVTGDLLGSFTLANGAATAAVPFNADANTMTTAVNSIITGADVSVTRSGPDKFNAYTWDLSFRAPAGDVPDL
ncbi:hypothetical protein JKP88DRAFT_146257, partial [Tribonema minus]